MCVEGGVSGGVRGDESFMIRCMCVWRLGDREVCGLGRGGGGGVVYIQDGDSDCELHHFS